jgi:hypothetical protein
MVDLAMAVAVSCQRGPGFAPESVHIAFVMDKVALGLIFSKLFGLAL